jgi:hypothetical protein
MEEAILLRVDGDLTIDSQGLPVDYTIRTALPPILSEALQRNVRSWRFKPASSNVGPSIVHERVRITLATEKNDGKHPIRIDNVSFFLADTPDQNTSSNLHDPVSMSYGRGNHVQYPHAGLSRQVNVDALVYAHVTPEGRVDQAMVAQIALLNLTGRQKDLHDFAKAFEDQLISDVKIFRFNVTIDQNKLEALKASDPNGVGIAFTARIPVEFVMLGSRSESGAAWQQEVRTPLRSPPWLRPDTDCGWPGVADLAAGENLTLQSDCARLTTPVVGTEVVSFASEQSLPSTSSGNPP